MRQALVTSIICLALGSCAAPHTHGPDSHSHESHNHTPEANTSDIPFAEISFKGPRATKAERELCEGIGGSVSQQGLAGYEMCVRPYADAGTVCSDSSECLGQCRAQDFGQAQQSQITGTCQANNIPFGCYAEVKNSTASPALCVD